METQKPLVLIVDDDEVVHELLGGYLRVSGFEVASARNGVESIDMASQLLPEVIVMDFDLPGRNGCQSAEILKTAKRTSNIPIVLMTGHVEMEYRALARCAGCDAFLVKPCSPERVHHVILETILTIERAAPRSAAPRSRRLLLVDDDVAILETLHEALEEEGYEVVDATNGMEAIAHLRENHARPDLILLDLMMPVIDGWAFRSLQRKDQALAAIPVVTLTAVPMGWRAPLDVTFCLDKPLQLDELLATIEKALQQRCMRPDMTGHRT